MIPTSAAICAQEFPVSMLDENWIARAEMRMPAGPTHHIPHLDTLDNEEQARPDEGTLISHSFSPMRIRVLIVDDHEVVRKGMSALLAEEPDFEVVGQANTGSGAIALAQQLQPDIILLDILLGTTNGLDIAQQLYRANQATRVVIFTGLTDNEQLVRALRVGVHGYLQKSLPLRDILNALRAVYRGERVISDQQAMTHILTEFGRLTRERERVHSGLSDLEIELVRLAAEGCSNKEIASRQFWSEVTVKRKMQDIYRKLQVTDRAQAVAEAMRMGLI